MSELLAWSFGLLGAGSAALGCLAVARGARAARLWRDHVAVLERELRYQGARLTGEALARAQLAAAGASLALSLVLGPLGLGCALLAVAAGPVLALRRLRAKRTELIEAQLDGFLLALAHSLKATPALGDGLRSSADVVAPPLADELRVLLREHELGTPLDRGLENMAARVGSPVVSAALSTLRIARSAGGDFARTIEQSAATLREMARLQGVVRAKTAEGRAQSVAVSVIPGPTLYLIDEISPGLLEPLWSTDAGHGVLAVALAMWVIAFLAARRITHVDI